jgi:hypothetical protein
MSRSAPQIRHFAPARQRLGEPVQEVPVERLTFELIEQMLRVSLGGCVVARSDVHPVETTENHMAGSNRSADNRGFPKLILLEALR